MNVNDSIKILNGEDTKRILNAFSNTEEIKKALSVLIEFAQSEIILKKKYEDFGGH